MSLGCGREVGGLKADAWTWVTDVAAASPPSVLVARSSSRGRRRSSRDSRARALRSIPRVCSTLIERGSRRPDRRANAGTYLLPGNTTWCQPAGRLASVGDGSWWSLPAAAARRGRGSRQYFRGLFLLMATIAPNPASAVRLSDCSFSSTARVRRAWVHASPVTATTTASQHAPVPSGSSIAHTRCEVLDNRAVVAAVRSAGSSSPLEVRRSRSRPRRGNPGEGHNDDEQFLLSELKPRRDKLSWGLMPFPVRATP